MWNSPDLAIFDIWTSPDLTFLKSGLDYGNIKTRSRQGHARLGQGQVKVNAKSRQGKAKLKARLR